MEKYFLNCHSEDAVKIRYRKLSKSLHPDKHGNSLEAKEKFQDMVNERDAVLKRIYQKQGKTDEEIQERIKTIFDSVKADIISGDKIKYTNLMDIGTEIAEKWKKENPGKTGTMQEALQYTLKTLFGSPDKKSIDKKDDRKKLG